MKVKASELIRIHLLEGRNYIYKENFDYFHDKYFTENPEKDIKIENDYEIDIFNFEKNYIEAVIYESNVSDLFYKVTIVIEFDEKLYQQFLEDVLHNDYLTNMHYIDNCCNIEIIKTIKLGEE